MLKNLHSLSVLMYLLDEYDGFRSSADTDPAYHEDFGALDHLDTKVLPI